MQALKPQNPLRKNLLILAALMAAAGSAQAQQTPIYIGASGGMSRLDFDFKSQIQTLSNGTLPVTRADVTDKQDAAWKITAGYQALPWLAVELDYVNLGEYRTHFVFDGFGRFVRDGQYELDGWNISAVFSQQVDEKVSINGRLGVFTSNYKYSETGQNFPAFTPSPISPTHSFVARDLKKSALSYGLGAHYKINNNLAVRVDWDRYTKIGNPIANNEEGNGKFDNVDFISLGVIYRF